MESKAEADPGFGAALETADLEYAAERDELLPEGADPVPSGGVGGSSVGVKCLHAHYAHTRAGGENPVGSLVEQWIEPLDCTEPCVAQGEMNPAWVNRP